MAKPKAPLLSLGASGKLGGALVYGKWKGIDVAREYVVPANPQTAAQVTQRSYMTESGVSWHGISTPPFSGTDKEAWNRYAGVLGPMSGFNAYAKEYITEKVAGGTPAGRLQEMTIIDTTAASFDMSIRYAPVGTEVCTLNLGNSKTFFSVVTNQAAVAGVATFTGIDTGFVAGETVYFWVRVGIPGTNRARSGLYTALLT